VSAGLPQRNGKLLRSVLKWRAQQESKMKTGAENERKVDDFRMKRLVEGETEG
jgi:hypothetical protein